MKRLTPLPTVRYLGTRGLVLLLALGFAACADEGGGDAREYGSFTIGLRDGPGDWFRLRIFDTAPDQNLSGSVIFDTKCIEASSRTYELTNIPAGQGRWVVMESFGNSGCNAESRRELGYRGGVDIPGGYYHISLVDEHGVTPLPSRVNISESLAEPVDYCESDAACASYSAMHTCYSTQAPSYWCVPSCIDDADCVALHPRATCDTSSGWCTIESLYPLDASGPRAMAKTVPLADGDVGLIGGYGVQEGSVLLPAPSFVERFDSTSGLFSVETGMAGELGGFFGLGQLSPNRFVAVGGLSSWDLSKQPNGGFRLTGTTLSPVALSDKLLVVDFNAKATSAGSLPTPMAAPAVLALASNELLVAGGLVPSADGGSVVSTNKAWICTIGAGAACNEVGPMTTSRMGAAIACEDEACATALIIGGNQSGAVVERVTFTEAGATFAALGATGLTARLFFPEVCGMRLVGGSFGEAQLGGVQPSVLTVQGNSVTATPLLGNDRPPANLFPAVAQVADDRCWVAGGIRDSGPSTTVFAAYGDEMGPSTYDLSTVRIGAAAGVIGSGPLSGSALIVGGLEVEGTKPATGRLTAGAEILRP